MSMIQLQRNSTPKRHGRHVGARCHAWVLFLFTSLFGEICFAQQGGFSFEGSGTWFWSASVDNGATWTRGLIEVPSSQSNVLIRGSCQFPATVLGAQQYLGDVNFHIVVTGVNGAGPADDLPANSYFPGRDLGIWQLPRLRMSRFGNQLKLDDLAGESNPPFVVPGGIDVRQNHPNTGAARNYDNPIHASFFSLVLDGSPGDRVVQGSFRVQHPLQHNDPNRWLFTYNFPLQGDPNRLNLPLMTDEPLTIRVVPAPQTLATLAVGWAWFGYARRRPIGNRSLIGTNTN
jgi:hypothetical protein